MLYLAEFFSPFYLMVCDICLGFIVGGLVFPCLFLASEQKVFSDYLMNIEEKKMNL